MRGIFVFVCLMVSVWAIDPKVKENFSNEMQKAAQACIAELNPTTEDIETLMSHRIPESHTGKCMLLCFHKHFKVMNEDGTINDDGAESFFATVKQDDADLYKQLKDLYDFCRAKLVSNDDPCIVSAEFARCGFEEGRARGMDEALLE